MHFLSVKTLRLHFTEEKNRLLVLCVTYLVLTGLCPEA